MAKLVSQLYSWCVRFAKKKPNAFFTVVVTALFVYLVFTGYMLCCKYPLLELPRVPSSYVLDFNGQTLYELDFNESQNLTQVRKSCKEQINFVFIKGMKCATSTLLGVFYRFGYTRNLSFVSPLNDKMYLNWPFPMTRRSFRPSGRGYNILTDHAVYTESVMEAIMPKDTLYISIIREPFAQLKSVFQYFKVAKISGVPANVSSPVDEYFAHLERYEKAYTDHGAKYRWCVPDGFSMTRNLLSHCHGMPLGFPPGSEDVSNSTAAIDRYIEHLDRKFSLVMIVEYFYESLVLLRRLMCWGFKDILFINANIAKYDFQTNKIKPETMEAHRNWSNADYRFYRYFNKTLWGHISRQGPRFFEEVKEFKIVESLVQDYCQTIYAIGKRSVYPSNVSETVIPQSVWTDQFTVTPNDCWMLGPNPYELLHQVQREHDVREAALLAEWNKIPDNRTENMKSTC
ncbi:unnamed protein product [Lymnaea stagnalis]|uniref:Uncharacterized protein n=1 Tax=Lymnaea stagnalis TaxID=6523 RepID=A0AAV2H0C4_LYMST